MQCTVPSSRRATHPIDEKTVAAPRRNRARRLRSRARAHVPRQPSQGGSADPRGARSLADSDARGRRARARHAHPSPARSALVAPLRRAGNAGMNLTVRAATSSRLLVAVAALVLHGACGQPATGVTVAGPAKVVDGDSLEIGATQIRLFGIDAPEGRQTCARNGTAWRCGEDAATHLRAL